MKHTAGPLEVDTLNHCGQPPSYALVAKPPYGVCGPYPIADTLNQHHCIDPDEARANAERLALCWNEHDALVDWKQSAMSILSAWDSVGEALGGATVADLGRSNVDIALREVKRLQAVNAELLAVAEEWATYFDKLNEESIPGDALIELRNQFHAKRIRKTREAIAHAKGQP